MIINKLDKVDFNNEQTDKDVKIDTEAIFLKKTADSKKMDQYYWVYRIVITNKKEKAIQLLSREWTIIDQNGKVEQINGIGVVGEQPVIEAEQSYEYTSFVCLGVESGIMQGLYEFIETDTGNHFKAKIPAFSLDSDKSIQRPN